MATILSGLGNYIYSSLVPLSSGQPIPSLGHIILTIGIISLTIQFIGDPKTAYKDNINEVVAMKRIEFDFIVVGTGSAGSVMTGRLTEASKFTTLTIEAGCYDPMYYSEVPLLFSGMLDGPQDWQFRSVDDRCCHATIGGCRFPRGKTIGGSAAVNLMYDIRGDPRIYDSWESEYNWEGWSFEDLLPYFRKAEGNTNRSLNAKYHGFNGPLIVSEYVPSPYYNLILNAANDKGFPTVDDINVPGHGPCICPVKGTVYNGRRYSVAKAYINPIQDRPNFKLIKCAIVVRIIFKGNKAIGVEFIYKGKRFTAYARREVVICAGVIGSPVILQLSGIGRQEDLNKAGIKSWNPLPTGAFLQDHLAVFIWIACDGPSETPLTILTNVLKYYQTPKTGEYAGIGTLPCVGFFNTSSNSEAHIETYFYVLERNTVNLPVLLSHFTHYTDEINQQLMELNQRKMLILAIPTLLDPESRGYIVANSTDGVSAMERPFVDYNYLSTSYDQVSVRQSMQLILSFLDTPTWKAANAEFVEFNLNGCSQFTNTSSDEYVDCYIRYMASSLYHPVGTCRGGPKPADPQCKNAETVVNNECQVHCVKNLTVVDASVMPKLIWGNTNVPTVAIAEKAADLMKIRHGISVSPLI